MSKAINNPNFIATNDVPETQAPITGQIVDGFDFPHTGLIKAFNLACAGSYAINGFNGTNIDATQATFAAGNVFLKGVFTPVGSGVSNDQPTTITITATSYNQHLLVARGGNVVLIQGTATDEVPPFADGDVIIALLKYTGSDPMQIQYLTFNQTSKSLSVGRLNGGVYTEGLSIKSNAGHIEIEAKESDKDIIFKVKDGASVGQEVMRINAADKRVGIGTNAPVAPLHVMTSNTDETLRLQSDDATATTAPDLIFYRNSASPAASDGIGHIKFLGKNASNNDIMYAAMYASVRDPAGNSEDGSLIFTTETAGNDRNRLAIMPTEVNINDNSQALDFRVESANEQHMLFVDGTNNRIGIKESNPDTDLHMKSGDSEEPMITLENTNADGSAPSIHFIKNSSSPAVGDNLGVLYYTGDNTVGGVHKFAEILTEATNVTNGAETSKFTFKVSKAGTLVPVMQITDTEVMVNDNAISSNTLNFRAQSNNNQNMLLVDATNNRVGIGTATPTETLDVVGTVKALGVRTESLRSQKLETIAGNSNFTLVASLHAGTYVIYSNANGTITLPLTSAIGEHYTILNTTGGNITVGRNGNNINGAASDITVGTYNGVTCISIGNNDWIALGV